MERIFNDANEPFWRSAKRVELGPIEPAGVPAVHQAGFRDNGRDIEDNVVDRVARRHRRPSVRDPGALLLPVGRDAGAAHVAREPSSTTALAKLLRSEHSHLSDLWDRATANQRLLLAALADEAGRPLSEDYRARHGLRGASTTQKAIDGLVKQEIVARDAGFVRIAEPFYAEWIRRVGTGQSD